MAATCTSTFTTTIAIDLAGRDLYYNPRRIAGGDAMLDFEYTVTTKKSFDEAVQAVQAVAAAKGFRVLHIHDVKATLEEKGFHRDPLKIIEVCNAKFAHAALKADVKIALMLPCPIAVYVQAGETRICTMRPKTLVQFYPKAEIEGLAQEVDDFIVGIVKSAAGSEGA
ncbi:MAG: DUF302 domain-containing protein [Acidobacteriota bacterium]